MADGAIERFDAESGVGITGIAGPTAARRRSPSATSASASRNAAARRLPAIRSCPATARTSATARRRSRCTCCGGCCAARTCLCDRGGLRATAGSSGDRRPARAAAGNAMALPAGGHRPRARRRSCLFAGALRALGRRLRLRPARADPRRAPERALERRPFPSRPGRGRRRGAADNARPRLAWRRDRVPAADPPPDRGGTRRDRALAAGLRVLRRARAAAERGPDRRAPRRAHVRARLRALRAPGRRLGLADLLPACSAAAGARGRRCT